MNGESMMGGESEALPPEQDAPPPEAPPEEAKEFSFTPPKTFALPEGASGPGDTFDMVCTFKVEDDGKLCLEKLGENDMKEGKKESKPAKKPTYDGLYPNENAAELGKA